MARHRLWRPHHWPRRTILFYVLFQGVHLALFGYGWYAQQANPRLATLNKLTYSVWLSRGAALALSLDACLLVLPMCRECLRFLRPKMRWMPLHDSQWFHRQVAYSLLFYTVIHAGSHYINFFNVAKLRLRPTSAIRIIYTQPGGITGQVMLLCMLLIFTTAHSKIRRQAYEGFWYIHHLFIVFYLALLCHGTGCFVRDSVEAISPFAGSVFWEHCIGYQSFRWELVPLTLYLAERIFRFYRSRKDARVLAILRHAPELFEIRFEKAGMKYEAGEWIFVKFPDIMANQWHPFSITSCPSDNYVSIHIAKLGDFTGTFTGAFDTNKDHYQTSPVRWTNSKWTDSQELHLESGQMFPRIRIDGPYSSLAGDVFKHEVSVMVGAGIGVAPWASTLKSIWHLRNDAEANAKSRLKRLEFIWICKDILQYKWLHEQILALEEQSQMPSRESRWPTLRSRIFITRQLKPVIAEAIEIGEVGGCSHVETEMKRPGAPQMRSAMNTSTAASLPAQAKAEMRYRRPDFVHELGLLTRELVEERYAGSEHGRARKLTVGVFYCGPKGAGKALRDACVQVSTRTVEYRFRKEHG